VRRWLGFRLCTPELHSRSYSLYYKRLLPSCCIISVARIAKKYGRNCQTSPLLHSTKWPAQRQRWTINKHFWSGRETHLVIIMVSRPGMVSRFHARITPTLKGIVLEDLDSRKRDTLQWKSGSRQSYLARRRYSANCTCPAILIFNVRRNRPLSEGEIHPGRLRLEMRSRAVWVDEKLVDPPLSALQFHVLRVLYDTWGKY